MLIDWLDKILETPLSHNSKFCLAEISSQNRMDELEFHFPLDADAKFLDEVKKEGYLSTAHHLAIPRLEGMMTGLIDLVIRHENQYFLIDYKSNYLGDNEINYSNEHLIHAVQEHQYDLQYLIYCVALNRFLSSRLQDYDYEKQFGGVIYLFLRGMNGKDQSGIYFDKPAEQLLETLDSALGGSDR
jgi:exodeoxyribonuclease V beta subunit